jgi:hypothetical protein
MLIGGSIAGIVDLMLAFGRFLCRGYVSNTRNLNFL